MTTARPAIRLRLVGQVQTKAMHVGFWAGIFGLAIGLIVGLTHSALTFSGRWSFSEYAAGATAATAAVASTISYLRSQRSGAATWQLRLARWRRVAHAIGVALAHTALTAIITIGVGELLGVGFQGFIFDTFWSAVLMGVATAAAAYLTYLSAARVTSSQLSTLLVLFMVSGVLTAMLTTSRHNWWVYHFSDLGASRGVAGIVFNGTLIGGGLIVITFAAYVGNDIDRLYSTGVIRHRSASTVISTAFALMGFMLATVGVVRVDVNVYVHNAFAAGIGLTFALLLTVGQILFRGLPRGFFEGCWIVLGIVILSGAAYFTGNLGLTAFEIIVFAMLFIWFDIVIRFLTITTEAVDRAVAEGQSVASDD